MRTRLLVIVAALALLALSVSAALLLSPALRSRLSALIGSAGGRTVEQRTDELGAALDPRWMQRLSEAGLPPAWPRRITLVVLKQERLLHMIMPGDETHPPIRLATFSVTAASGTPGPKLRAGDHQVPEGVYTVESLNPNSAFHLALRVGYPNAEDRAAARADGRAMDTLGSDIMIHGGAASIGCIAIGDTAIEEVFLLTARVGIEHTEIVIAPSAAPLNGLTQSPGSPPPPPWLTTRYEQLDARLRELGAGM